MSKYQNIRGNRDFVKLWVGQTISKFGTHITFASVEVLAIVHLQATPQQLGFLRAFGGLALLLLGLVAGVWVDRMRRRPVLIVMDLGRGLTLMSIPVFAFFGWLRMEWLYVNVAVIGALTLFFEVADSASVPNLVPQEQLVDANSKMGLSESLAEVAGPSLGGVLVQVLSAPLAVILDAISYLISAVCIMQIKTPESKPEVSEQTETFWQEIITGLKFVVGNPVLRALVGSMASINFFGNFIGTLYWVYLVRELHLPVWVVGASIGVGGLGSIVAALLAENINKKLGMRKTLWITMFCWFVSGFALPSLYGNVVVITVLLFLLQFLGDFPISIYFITEVSLRQSLVPNHLLGRTQATVNFLTRGVAPIGALLSGYLATQIGIRPTLYLFVLGPALGLWWLKGLSEMSENNQSSS